MRTRTPHQPAFRLFILSLATLLALPLVAITAFCQSKPQQPAPATQPTPLPQAFEAASIRLEDPRSTMDTNSPAFRVNQTTFPSNRLVLRHTNLQSMIADAYGIDFDKTVGGPDWLGSQHYNVTAKVEGNAMLSMEQMRPLQQALLEERFHLKVHRQQKIVPGYALVIAKGGPKLQPNKGAPFIGINAGNEFKYQNDTVGNFAKAIGYWSLKQQVVDKTGIQGQYDFDLKCRPATGPYIDDPRFANLPDLFTALQEQLGLKLVPEKVPVDTLVIDHVDKIPTEN